jgi:tetratricopeptide (TPR) repeat protein
VNPPPSGAAFTLKRVQQMLGLSRTVVDGLIGAGFVTPSRGARNEHRFSFRDLMLLRTAHSLQSANIPPRKILRALTKLQATLPEELPLTGLRITAVGSDVVVSDRLGRWEAHSGQLLMDFEVTAVGNEVAFLKPAGAPVPAEDARRCFEQGEATEVSDPPAAEAAYRRAIELDPAHVDAYVNLGAMLCEARRFDAATALYEQALLHGAEAPLIHFNQAVVLEDSGRLPEALGLYAHCLALDPAFADAHYNSARLLDKLGDAQAALRHFSAYRRLSRSAGP